jgi:cytochrome P450
MTRMLVRSASSIYHARTYSQGLTYYRSQVGSGLLAADGESHKRQRKNISPGFTSVKIREYLPTFYDSAHKVRRPIFALIALSKMLK